VPGRPRPRPLLRSSPPASDKAYAVEQRLSALIAGNDTWHNLGSMSNGWTNVYARYMSTGVAGLVMVQLGGLAPGSTKTDGTAIWSSANGFPSAYRVSVAWRTPVYFQAFSAAGGEMPAFEFETDGSVQCFGFGGTAITSAGVLLILPTT
jgi:hypothetical protein